MNCNKDCVKIREKLSDFIDSKLSPKAAEEVKKHLEECVDCKLALGGLKNTIEALKSVKEKELPAFYQTQLDARLDEAARERINIKAHPWVKFGWQIALGIFLIGIIAGGGLIFISQRTAKENCPYTIKIGEVGILSFNLYSKENVKTIAFNVELPEGLALASRPKDRTFKWEGELVKGENVISLYVKGLKEGKWAVSAKLQSDDETIKEFKMPLCVTDKKG